jgi:hypothetical protein
MAHEVARRGTGSPSYRPLLDAWPTREIAQLLRHGNVRRNTLVQSARETSSAHAKPIEPTGDG